MQSGVTRESILGGIPVITQDAAIKAARVGCAATKAANRTPERPLVAVVGAGSDPQSVGVIFETRRSVFKLSSAHASATACAAFDASRLERARPRRRFSGANHRARHRGVVRVTRLL